MGCSVVICKSDPTVADAVYSSTKVPVYPCTAARVTIDNVSNIITDNLFIDSVEPEPFNPRLTSFNNMVLPKNNCIILGPFAPILPNNNAPPIHNKNGPNNPSNPSTNQLEFNPSSEPFISSHVSVAAIAPITNINQCNHLFGLLTSLTFFTPSSISNSINSLERLRPKSKAKPNVAAAVIIVELSPKTGLTSTFSKLSNAIKPTLESTNGTTAIAKIYPATQAKVDITANSNNTIPCSPFDVAPITL